MPGRTLQNLLQNYLLELDGKASGRLFNMEGGGFHADIVSEKLGPDHIQRKHIAGVKYEDIAVTCGTGMSRVFYDWIRNSLGGSPLRKSGAIVTLNSSHSPVQRLEFHNALINSVEFPECDAASKDPAYIRVSITPEFNRSTDPKLSQKAGVYISALSKSWHISDFRLTIDGLESDCAHVRRIGGLRLGQKIKETDLGEKLPTGVDFSDLVINLPIGHATSFMKWVEDFVEKGQSGPQNEKKGRLYFFAPNLSKAYFELELNGLGPYEMNRPMSARSSSMIPIEIKMYCDEIKFSTGPSAVM